MSKTDIFHFNHIDANIDEEKLKEMKDLYTYYHKITWIYNNSYKRNKQKNKLCCKYIKYFTRHHRCNYR